MYETDTDIHKLVLPGCKDVYVYTVWLLFVQYVCVLCYKEGSKSTTVIMVRSCSMLFFFYIYWTLPSVCLGLQLSVSLLLSVSLSPQSVIPSLHLLLTLLDLLHLQTQWCWRVTLPGTHTAHFHKFRLSYSEKMNFNPLNPFIHHPDLTEERNRKRERESKRLSGVYVPP